MSEEEMRDLEPEILETLKREIDALITDSLLALTQPESLVSLNEILQKYTLDLKDTQLEVKILYKDKILMEKKGFFCPYPPNPPCAPPPGRYII